MISRLLTAIFSLFVGILFAWSQCPTSASDFSAARTITEDCSLDVNDIFGITSTGQITIQSGATLTINFTGGLRIFRHNNAAIDVSGSLIINDGDLIVDNLSSDPNMSVSGLVQLSNGRFDLGQNGESNTVSLDLTGEVRVSDNFNFYDDGILTGGGCYEASIFINDGDDSGFTGGTCAPLPVELYSFDARQTNNTVELEWVTVLEINNEQFDVQRSINGLDFKTIGTVKGNGNSSEVHTYTYRDQQVAQGGVYYRLKQIDYDGAYEYSFIRYLKTTLLEDKPKLYPTYVSDHIQLAGSASAAYQIRLYDLAGKPYLQSRRSMSLNRIEQTLNDLLTNMPPSLYVLQLISPTGDSRHTIRFVRQ